MKRILFLLLLAVSMQSVHSQQTVNSVVTSLFNKSNDSGTDTTNNIQQIVRQTDIIDEQYEIDEQNEPVSPGSKLPFFAFKTQVGMNITTFNGNSSDLFDPGIGWNLGASLDFWNNSFLGAEVGMYFTSYRQNMWTGDAYDMNIKLRYLDFQALLNPRYFLSNNSAIEANLGLSFLCGLDAPAKIKGVEVGNLFDNTTAYHLESNMSCILYGATFRWKDGYLRFLCHHGITDIRHVNDNSKPTTLWNAEIAIGIIY